MVTKRHNLEDGPGRHLYDDEKLENILHYFKIEDDFEALIKYIKKQGIIDEEE